MGTAALAAQPLVGDSRHTGGWAAGVPLPWATQEVCCTTWNGQVVVAGGFVPGLKATGGSRHWQKRPAWIRRRARGRGGRIFQGPGTTSCSQRQATRYTASAGLWARLFAPASSFRTTCTRSMASSGPQSGRCLCSSGKPSRSRTTDAFISPLVVYALTTTRRRVHRAHLGVRSEVGCLGRAALHAHAATRACQRCP